MPDGAVEGSPRGAGQEISSAVREMIEPRAWIRPEQVPVVRMFAEQDEIRRANGFLPDSARRAWRVHMDKNKDLAARRLVNDLRLIMQTQLNLANVLLMTPARSSQVAPGEEALDLVSLTAQAATAEPVDPDPPPGEEPPVEEPDRPAPMKSA